MSAERGKAKGRLISVFGSVGCRSEDRRRDLAEAAEELSDISVITSDDPGRESAEKICLEIYSFYKDVGKAIVEPDREKAILRALEISREGDSLLLLGKGHEKTQLIGDEYRYFSEKDIILSLGARRS
jgi:UDP-N-acetylmuramoyl-L-alanyl-D-glutamate--2,6-diaminopimelate ligase